MHIRRSSFTALLTSLLMSVFLLSGCTSIIHSVTDEPIQPDEGKRSFGSMIDDKQLEVVVGVNIKKASAALEQAHLNVSAYNGVILLTGQVGDNQSRLLAGETANKARGVRQVHNEIEIAPATSAMIRTADSWLSTKVKTKLLAYKDIPGRRINVVTENSTVFLMGLLSRVEAEKATNVARNTGGVRKVVKVFEYID
ncbi:MAG: BON domain-containing protein [Cellvibrionaceae bacterium]